MLAPDTIVAAAGWLAWLLYAGVVLRWLLGQIELSRAERALLVSPHMSGETPPPVERVSVVIAAHNEAGGIEACLERIAAQTEPPDEVIVANDRSTDDTGARVRTFAQARGTAAWSVVDITALPAGWIGKTHALAVAGRRATGDLLVFTDADVVWHPALLATVRRLMAARQLDLLSLWPQVVVASFWEGLLLPACAWVLGLWFRSGRPERVEDTPAFANGQLLAIRRAAYERIGGHAAVADELAEDVALARRAQAAQMRRQMLLGRDLLSTRMYENLAQITAGWRRIFAGALRTPGRMALSVVAAALGVWAPFIVLAVLLARWFAGCDWSVAALAWAGAAILHLAAMYSVLHRQFALGFAGRVYLALFPLGVLGAAVLLVRSMWLSLGFGSVSWGGVRYAVRGSRVTGLVSNSSDSMSSA